MSKKYNPGSEFAAIRKIQQRKKKPTPRGPTEVELIKKITRKPWWKRVLSFFQRKRVDISLTEAKDHFCGECGIDLTGKDETYVCPDPACPNKFKKGQGWTVDSTRPDTGYWR